MDEATGNIADATGNGWTGTAISGSVYNQTGIINTAITPGTSSAAFDVSATLMSANPTNQSFSIQVWLKGNGTGNNSAFIGQCLPNVYWDGYDLAGGPNGHGQIGFQVHNNADTNFQVNSATDFTNNVFHHVCMGFDAPNSLIWIQMDNETRVTTGGVTSVKRASDIAVTIGNYSTHAGPSYNNSLDEIAIWTAGRVLTSSDVNLLFNNGNGRPLSFYS